MRQLKIGPKEVNMDQLEYNGYARLYKAEWMKLNRKAELKIGPKEVNMDQ